MDKNEAKVEKRKLELLETIQKSRQPRPVNEIIQLSWSGALIFGFIILVFLGVDEFTTGDKSLGLAILTNLFSIVVGFFMGKSFFRSQ